MKQDMKLILSVHWRAPGNLENRDDICFWGFLFYVASEIKVNTINCNI